MRNHENKYNEDRRPLKSRRALMSLSISLMALSACTMTPEYKQPALPVPDQYPVLQTSSLADKNNDSRKNSVLAIDGLTNEKSTLKSLNRSAAEIGWRDVFHDRQLQDLIQLALNNNRDLRITILNVAQTRAQLQIQQAALFPQLNAQAEGGRTRTPNALTAPRTPNITSQYQVGLGASWELDFFGRVQSLREQALNTYLATAEARRAATLSLISSVAQQYLLLRAIESQIRVTEKTLDSARESFRIQRAQLEQGLNDELVVSQAEGIVRQAEANYAEQQREQAQAINALTLLVGQHLPSNLIAGKSLEEQSILADIPAGLPSDLLLRRPDILQAEYQLRAANANIGAARAAFFPSISLTGSFGTASPSLGGLFKASTAAWQFLPKINLPIFAGGANHANLTSAKIGQQIAVANYEKAVQTAFREVADSLAARATYDDQLKASTQNVASQKRRLKLATLRFDTGTDDYLNVLTAQTDYYKAEQNQVNVILGYLNSLVQFYQRLGGGWLAETPVVLEQKQVNK